MINQNKKLFLTIFILALIAGLAVSFCLVPESWMKIAGIDNQEKNYSNSNSPAGDNGDGDNNSNDNNQEMEIYQAELFVRAPWGDGKGEVGLSNLSEMGVEDAGPNYGPQSFDIAENGHLFLLDSVNERVIEYDDQGKYLKDFPIACGGTGDIRVSPDEEYLYVFSWRCEGIYKYSIEGEFLEGYKLPREIVLGTGGLGGLDFDENGNIMLGWIVESIDEKERFYQIGKNGNEWSYNNYFGHISESGKEFYFSKFINDYTVGVFETNRKDIAKKIFELKLPTSDNDCYFVASDKKNNIYLKTILGPRISEMTFEKYTKEGKLLTSVDILNPLRESYEVTSNKLLPDYTYAESPLVNKRINSKGNIYYMFTFKNEGIRIFRYFKN